MAGFGDDCDDDIEFFNEESSAQLTKGMEATLSDAAKRIGQLRMGLSGFTTEEVDKEIGAAGDGVEEQKDTVDGQGNGDVEPNIPIISFTERALSRLSFISKAVTLPWKKVSPQKPASINTKKKVIGS